MNFWGWLAAAEWYDFLLIGFVLMGCLTIIGVILRGKTLDWKNKKITDISSAHQSEEVTQHLEVRDYHHLLVEVFDEIGKEILIRFKQNGWLSLGDWDGYVTEMINYAHDTHTRFLDEHYYYAAILKREDIYNWNLALSPILDTIYRELFSSLKNVMKVSYTRIDDYKKELKDVEDKRVCEVGQKRCPIFIHVLKLSGDIVMEEYVKMPERAKTEIDRVMTRLIQEEFSHYLKKYKEILLKIQNES